LKLKEEKFEKERQER